MVEMCLSGSLGYVLTQSFSHHHLDLIEPAQILPWWQIWFINRRCIDREIISLWCFFTGYLLWVGVVGAGHGPTGKLEMETEGHKLKSDLFQVLPTWSVPEQKKPCAGKAGQRSLKRKWGMQLRAGRGRKLSASLNMDKLNYFFQPLVQSFPLFPIILSLKEVAWAMIEKEKKKNHPSLLSLFKKRERFGILDEFTYVEKAFLVEC